MRFIPTLLPIALLLSSLPVIAQEGPRVLFCSGSCFAVDAKGVRTPAPKGTQLAPGQRLETGPTGYAQVRLGRDAAIGIGEQARVRFDGDAVILDQGRVRMVGGQALGLPEGRARELRTGDGTFVLRSADVEVKKAGGPQTVGIPTFMKVNAGDAMLRGIGGDTAIPRDRVLGVADGKVITGRVINVSEVTPTTRTSLAVSPSRTVPTAPVVTALPTVVIPSLRDPIVLSQPTIYPTLSTSTSILAQPTLTTTTVLTSGTKLLSEPVLDTSTGTTTTLTNYVKTTDLTKTLSSTTTLVPTTTTKTTTTTLSPTISTTTFIRR